MTRHHSLLLSLLTSALCASAAAAESPHVHGVVNMEIGIDAKRLVIEMEAPLDSLLGYERAPRTQAERVAAQKMLETLRNASAVVMPNPEAGCTPVSNEVKAPILQGSDPSAPFETPAQLAGKAKPSKPDNHKHAKENDHAELISSYVFACTQPAQLNSIKFGLFGAFPKMRRVDVQVSGPKGQFKVVLKAPSQQIQLNR
jgi:Protein of unknown function (DUF2796)